MSPKVDLLQKEHLLSPHVIKLGLFMSYLKFDRSTLSNLDRSLQLEYIRSNRGPSAALEPAQPYLTLLTRCHGDTAWGTI